MNRIAERLGDLSDGKLLIPFFTVGFPDFRTSLDLVKVARDAGADFVEMGMPFSDPLADGPEIQYSSKVALDNGTNLSTILAGVKELRKAVGIPLILMGYYNPILAFGEKKFLGRARRCGVDGLIIPDLPVEEAAGFSENAEAHGLSVVFLVAPTSSRQRLALIDLHSTDFVYAVTVTGVTGTMNRFDTDTDRYLRHLRRTLSKPFVAGFGVSSAETALRLCRSADGVVIGSAMIRIIRSAKNKRDCLKQVGRFLNSVRRVI